MSGEAGDSTRVTNTKLMVVLKQQGETLKELCQMHRDDHDMLIRHDERMRILDERIEDVDKTRKTESRITGIANGVIAAVLSVVMGRPDL